MLQRMTKTEAAAALGKLLRTDKKPLSERSVERYIKRFNIPVMEKTIVGEDGRRHPVIDIAADDVKRIAQMVNQAAEQGSDAANPAALVRRDSPTVALSQLLAQLAAAAQPQRATVPVESKLTLTLREAAALSGYSEDFLVAALRADKLKGKKGRTRGWNIKRADLDAFVKEL
jgi:hypothetical protein